MPQPAYHFPAGFLWGSATAAQQVEGGNTNNNWSWWEQQPGRIYEGQKAGRACDWWAGRWKEDFDRAQETGQNAHRLSIEWSRIQPAPDRWDENALDYYRQMLRGLRDRGLFPMVTLHHFSDPLWLVERGGWENPDTPALFAKFVSKAVEALKEYCNLWVTINEPNVYVMLGWIQGLFPPGKQDLNLAAQVMINLIRGHALAYRAVHAAQPNARVGTAINYSSFRPAHPGSPFDRLEVRLLDGLVNNSFTDALVAGQFRALTKRARIPEAARTQDYIGVNYYTRYLVAMDLSSKGEAFSRRSFPAGAALSTNGFLANVPEGMFDALKWALRYKLPIFVTENGVEDAADGLRPRYLVEHLHQVWRAVNFNWPVKGYFHWSLVDNFEWERGWSQRFGLWGLDLDTQTRIRRKSVDLYAAICRENGLTYDTVRQYAPEALERLFPGLG